MSAKNQRAYWGTARLGDGDTVLVDEPRADRSSLFRRRGYALIWAVLAFGAVVSIVVLAVAGR